MRTFQTPTLTLSEPAPRCPKCGAEIFLGHSAANADRYYPIAVIKLQGADSDSGVRWVWNQDVYVDKKPSWLYWLFGFQWLPCPHCGEKLSRLGREKDLSVYPVVEVPPASPREQPAHATTPEDEDALTSTHNYPTGLPKRIALLLESRARKYARYGVIIGSTAVVIATALASYHETGAITPAGLIEAEKTNPVLWVVDVMPFLFAFWGQYVGYAMVYEASSIIVDHTRDLYAHVAMLEREMMHDEHDSKLH
jgi:hypothetical protein